MTKKDITVKLDNATLKYIDEVHPPQPLRKFK